jgi:hypothetical protein
MADHDVTAVVSLLLQVPTLVAMALILYWVSHKQDKDSCELFHKTALQEIRALELRVADKADRKLFDTMEESITSLDIKLSRSEALLEKIEGIAEANYQSLRELIIDKPHGK